MKKIILVLGMLSVGLLSAQNSENPKYEKSGNLVKATYFYENGAVKQEGFFKNKKLTGTWTVYDRNGVKTTVAQYKDGKKVGKWFVMDNKGLKEVIFDHNRIVSVVSSNVALK